MIKKAVSIFIILALALSVSSSIFAAPSNISAATHEENAIKLKSLGLFMGTDKGFELERAPTRTEALVLLLRLLGKENEAMMSSCAHPFNDVPTWACHLSQ